MVETWFSSAITDAEISLNSQFRVFRRDRSSRGGGVCVLVRNIFSAVELSVPPSLETVALEVSSHTDKIRIVCSYLTNAGCSTDRLSRTTDFCVFLDGICDADVPVIVLGDFNMPGIDWDSRIPGDSPSMENLFLHSIYRNNLTQIVDFPTHISGSTLDLILVTDTDLIHDLSSAQSPVCSDHAALSFACGPLSTVLAQPVPQLDFRNMDEASIAECLDGIVWNVFFERCKDANAMYSCFIELCSTLITHFVPVRRESGVMARIRRHITNLQSRLNSEPDSSAGIADKIRRAANRLRLLTESKLNIRDARGFYQYANTRLKSRDNIPSLRLNDAEISDDREKAQVFAFLFSEAFGGDPVGVTINRSPTVVPYADTPLSFDELDIYRQLCKLKPRASFVADALPPVFLKTFAIFLAEPLKIIFERSYRDGYVPDGLKFGVVSPTFKKGLRSDPHNYRPVTQCSAVSSVFERILVSHISHFIARNKLMDSRQHGFIQRRSTCTQLLHMVQDWASYINARDNFHCIYFDQKSAFDKVPHDRLLNKLADLGLHHKTVSWCRSFLRERVFIVKINDKFSAPSPAPTGVPQGCCLSPLLYTLFILDIRHYIPTGVQYLIYADDLKIYCPVNSDSDYLILQSAIDGVHRWCSENGMLLSPHKCLALKSCADNRQYHIDGVPLPVRDFTQDLGVVMSPRLDFGQHVLKLSKSISTLVNSIFRVFATKKPDFYLELYHSLIESRILYCCPVWRPHLTKHLNLLETTRRRFIKRLSFRCQCPPAELKSFTELFDEQDLRTYRLLESEQLLEHFLTIRANSLRSGLSFSPKTIARTELINQQFSWRIARRLNVF